MLQNTDYRRSYSRPVLLNSSSIHHIHTPSSDVFGLVTQRFTISIHPYDLSRHLFGCYLYCPDNRRLCASLRNLAIYLVTYLGVSLGVYLSVYQMLAGVYLVTDCDPLFRTQLKDYMKRSQPTSPSIHPY